jgi:hypothetical protein
MTSLLTRGRETAAVSLLLLGFIAAELYRPALPGMVLGFPPTEFHATHGYAVQLLELLEKNSLWALFRTGYLPSNDDGYHSALLGYLYIPALKLFGRNWMVAKHWPLFFAVSSLLFSYFFMRTLFGRGAALLTLALTVVHPSYLLGIRLGAGFYSHLHFFSTGALWALSRWWATQRLRWVGGAAFFLGMGLSLRLWFYWLIVGLLLTALVFWRDLKGRGGFRDRGRLGRAAGAAATCFAAGSFLIFYREIFHRSFLPTVMQRAGDYGDSPAWTYLQRVPDALLLFYNYLASFSLYDSIFSYAPLEKAAFYPLGNHLYPFFIAACAVFLVSRPAIRTIGNRARFLPLLLGTMMLLSPINPIGRPSNHVFFMYPLPQMMAATAIVAALTCFKKRKALVAAILAFVGIAEASTSGRYLQRIYDTPHTAHYTDAVYELADWVRIRDVRFERLLLYTDPQDILWHLYYLLPETRPEWTASPHPTVESDVALAGGTPGLPSAKEVLYVRSLLTAFRTDFGGSDGFHFTLACRVRPPPAFRLEATIRSGTNEPVFEVYSLEAR